MSRLPRPRRLILVLVAVMAVGLIQAGRGLIERSSASDLQTVTAMTSMEGPSGLTGSSLQRSLCTTTHSSKPAFISTRSTS